VAALSKLPGTLTIGYCRIGIESECGNETGGTLVDAVGAEGMAPCSCLGGYLTSMALKLSILSISKAASDLETTATVS
jgi:hypothetical protein